MVSPSGYKSKRLIEVTVAPRASIKYFKADKEYTLDTIPVEIKWACTNAKKVEIIGEGRQDLLGKIIVVPKKETTYILCVEDDFGIQKREITIKKLPLPLIKQVLVPAPHIERNIDITYQVPNFHLTIPIPTFNTTLCRIDIPHIPKLSESGYFVQSINKSKKQKSLNIFKSLFSIFSRKNKKYER